MKLGSKGTAKRSNQIKEYLRALPNDSEDLFECKNLVKFEYNIKTPESQKVSVNTFDDSSDNEPILFQSIDRKEVDFYIANHKRRK